MKKRIFIATAILFIFICSEIHACEPCSKILNFKETIQQADLIIVGEKIAKGPSVMMDHFPDASDWIEIKIFDILKGYEKEKRIRVNSWDGMCNYGIVIDNKRHVIFLQERKVKHENYQYDAVNFGCSVKTFSIKNDIIIFGDDEISVTKFVEML